MASTTESGIPNLSVNFEKLIASCIGYGAAYNPSKVSLKVASMQSLLESSVNSLATINQLLPDSTNAINQREILFEPLSALITKVVNASNASDLTNEFQADVKSIAKKLKGVRVSPKTPATPDDLSTPENEATFTISSSQMSFDQRIESLFKLIKLLASQAGYAPNEPELKVTALSALHASLVASNTAAINATVPVSNSSIARDKIFYSPETGICDIAQDAKSYVKSVFGASSPEYKQISGLEFKKRKL